MKFRLVETTTMEQELAKHFLPDMSNQRYPASGYLSSSKHRKKILSSLQNYCDTTWGERSNEMFDEIINSWQVHHINGIHPNEVGAYDNQIHNLALIPEDVHHRITKQNEEIVRRECMILPILHSQNVDKLLFRLLVVLKAEGINPSKVLRGSVLKHQKKLLNIPNIISDTFKKDYPTSSKDVIYLSDLI